MSNGKHINSVYFELSGTDPDDEDRSFPSTGTRALHLCGVIAWYKLPHEVGTADCYGSLRILDGKDGAIRFEIPVLQNENYGTSQFISMNDSDTYIRYDNGFYLVPNRVSGANEVFDAWNFTVLYA